jgi:Protein of unknown function (DUF3105)
MSYARGALVMAAALTLLAGCSSRTGPDAGGESGEAADTPAAAREFTPSKDNEDPSLRIEGIEVKTYRPMHAREGQRVAYDEFPPFGGAHDPSWADCSGVVYTKPVRNENMVHSLEHGAVWIAYNPTMVSGINLESLAKKVDGQPYLMLSPYPDLGRPVSLQSWGHQLKLESVSDERIDQFIAALRDNRYVTPEPGAPCGTNPEQFDVADPPPYDPSPPGPDAYPVQGP